MIFKGLHPRQASIGSTGTADKAMNSFQALFHLDSLWVIIIPIAANITLHATKAILSGEISIKRDTRSVNAMR